MIRTTFKLYNKTGRHQKNIQRIIAIAVILLLRPTTQQTSQSESSNMINFFHSFPSQNGILMFFSMSDMKIFENPTTDTTRKTCFRFTYVWQSFDSSDPPQTSFFFLDEDLLPHYSDPQCQETEAPYIEGISNSGMRYSHLSANCNSGAKFTLSYLRNDVWVTEDIQYASDRCFTALQLKFSLDGDKAVHFANDDQGGLYRLAFEFDPFDVVIEQYQADRSLELSEYLVYDEEDTKAMCFTHSLEAFEVTPLGDISEPVKFFTKQGAYDSEGCDEENSTFKLQYVDSGLIFVDYDSPCSKFIKFKEEPPTITFFELSFPTLDPGNYFSIIKPVQHNLNPDDSESRPPVAILGLHVDNVNILRPLFRILPTCDGTSQRQRLLAPENNLGGIFVFDPDTLETVLVIPIPGGISPSDLFEVVHVEMNALNEIVVVSSMFSYKTNIMDYTGVEGCLSNLEPGRFRSGKCSECEPGHPTCVVYEEPEVEEVGEAGKWRFRLVQRKIRSRSDLALKVFFIDEKGDAVDKRLLFNNGVVKRRLFRVVIKGHEDEGELDSYISMVQGGDIAVFLNFTTAARSRKQEPLEMIFKDYWQGQSGDGNYPGFEEESFTATNVAYRSRPGEEEQGSFLTKVVGFFLINDNVYKEILLPLALAVEPSFDVLRSFLNFNTMNKIAYLDVDLGERVDLVVTRNTGQGAYGEDWAADKEDQEMIEIERMRGKLFIKGMIYIASWLLFLIDYCWMRSCVRKSKGTTRKRLVVCLNVVRRIKFTVFTSSVLDIVFFGTAILVSDVEVERAWLDQLIFLICLKLILADVYFVVRNLEQLEEYFDTTEIQKNFIKENINVKKTVKNNDREKSDGLDTENEQFKKDEAEVRSGGVVIVDEMKRARWSRPLKKDIFKKGRKRRRRRGRIDSEEQDKMDKVDQAQRPNRRDRGRRTREKKSSGRSNWQEEGKQARFESRQNSRKKTNATAKDSQNFNSSDIDINSVLKEFNMMDTIKPGKIPKLARNKKGVRKRPKGRLFKKKDYQGNLCYLLLKIAFQLVIAGLPNLPTLQISMIILFETIYVYTGIKTPRRGNNCLSIIAIAMRICQSLFYFLISIAVILVKTLSRGGKKVATLQDVVFGLVAVGVVLEVFLLLVNFIGKRIAACRKRRLTKRVKASARRRDKNN